MIFRGLNFKRNADIEQIGHLRMGTNYTQLLMKDALLMKDRVGIYYYPYPENKRLRMYVRLKDGEVEFRMKNDDDPTVWNDHGWVPHGAILQAKVLYGKRGGFDPNRAYDIEIAKAIIRDEE